MVKFLAVLRVGSLAIVAAVSAANVVYNSQRVPPVRSGLPFSADAAVRQELRFASIRRALIARNVTGTIGYLGDLPADRMMADDPSVEDYYLAQFSLVPVVLDTKPGAYDWAVGSFRSMAPERRLSGEWRIEEDFGGGVYLLRRATR